MKRICIDIRCLLDEPQSGIGVHAELFLDAVLADTTTAYVLFFSGKKISASIKRLQKKYANSAHVTFFHLRFPNKVLNILWRLKLGPRVDILTKTTSVWMLNFNFIQLSKKARLYITCHDISFILFPHVYSLKGRLWHRIVAPQRLYKQATCIIAVSKRTAQDLQQLGIPPEKITTIYPCIPQFDTTPAATSPPADISPGYFLYIGTLDPRKNIIGLLQAYIAYTKKTHHPRPLLLGGRLGWHSREYYQKVMQLIRSSEHIYYLGYVDEQYKSWLMQQARACLFPSLYEGFGYPPLEALACGTPVIVSTAGSLPEVVRDAGWYVDPYDVQALTRALEIFDANDQVCAQYAAVGKKLITYWQAQHPPTVQAYLACIKKATLSNDFL